MDGFTRKQTQNCTSKSMEPVCRSQQICGVLLRQNRVDGEIVLSLCYMGEEPLQDISCFVYTGVSSSHTDEPRPAQKDARTVFEAFFADGGWDVVLDAMDLDLDWEEASAALVDVDQDGVEEMVLSMQFITAQQSYLLDIDEAGEVQVRQKAYNGRGTAGGSAVEIRYDTQEQRPVAVVSGYYQMGIWHGTGFLCVFEEDLTTPVLDLEVISFYLTGNTDFQQDMDQLRQDTDLWVEDGDFLWAFTRDGEYIPKEEYDALVARYVTPEYPALQMQQTSMDHPVPQA